jgi:hypothetical protein
VKLVVVTSLRVHLAPQRLRCVRGERSVPGVKVQPSFNFHVLGPIKEAGLGIATAGANYYSTMNYTHSHQCGANTLECLLCAKVYGVLRDASALIAPFAITIIGAVQHTWHVAAVTCACSHAHA